MRTQTVMQNGSDTVRGNVLSLREIGDPGTEIFEYCVSSNTLKLPSSGLGVMGEARPAIGVETFAPGMLSKGLKTTGGEP